MTTPHSQRDMGPLLVEAQAVQVRAPGGGALLLDDVSLGVRAGELVAVIGPSGAGKSTLLRALCGLVPLSGGAVFLDGRPVPLPMGAPRVWGYVPQYDALHDVLTPRRALDYTARLRLASTVTRAARAARVDRALAAVDLTGAVSAQPIRTLSGGQRKRVGIAAELLVDPPLLFLDEPTAGLDAHLEDAVMTLLRDLARGGRAVVVATHSVAHLELADRLVVVGVGGRLVYDGPPDRVLRAFNVDAFAGLYRRTGQPHCGGDAPPVSTARASLSPGATLARITAWVDARVDAWWAARHATGAAPVDGMAHAGPMTVAGHDGACAHGGAARDDGAAGTGAAAGTAGRGSGTGDAYGRAWRAVVTWMIAQGPAWRAAAAWMARSRRAVTAWRVRAAERWAGGSVARDQALVLMQRYAEIHLWRDCGNLRLMLAGTPLVALLLRLVAVAHTFTPRQFFATEQLLTMLSLAVIFFGTMPAAQELVKERALSLHERAAGLRVVPYILSKMAVLSAVCTAQAAAVLAIVAPTAPEMPRQGLLMATPHELVVTLTLTGWGAVAAGLLVSALVGTKERAMTAVAVVLLAQMLLDGVTARLDGVADWASRLTIARWSVGALGSTARLDGLQAATGRAADGWPQVIYSPPDGLHLVWYWSLLLLLTGGMLWLAGWIEQGRGVGAPLNARAAVAAAVCAAGRIASVVGLLARRLLRWGCRFAGAMAYPSERPRS